MTNPADVATQDLAEPGARELLQKRSLARLAYLGGDGLPRVIPIGFHWTGERIVVCTAETAPKVGALTARPHVALTIDTEDEPARELLIRGVAEIDVVDGVPEEFLLATTKSMDDEQREQFAAQARATYRRMARISIEPHWVRFYDFGAGRVPAFLLKLMQG
jgi:hypothetical protein